MCLKIIGHAGMQSTVTDNEAIVNTNNIEFKPISNLKNNSKYTEDEIKAAVDKLNKELIKDKAHAEYSYYEKLNTITVKIINDDTKEVIMELPPEKILDLISKMCELNGVIVDKDV